MKSTKHIKDLITLSKGKKPSFIDSPDSSSIRVIQIDDLRNDNNLKYTNDNSGIKAMKDDILIAWDGANAGTIGYGLEGYIGSTISLLRIRNIRELLPQYLGKFLQTKSQYLRDNSNGATIPHINRNSLLNLQIPLPPPP